MYSAVGHQAPKLLSQISNIRRPFHDKLSSRINPCVRQSHNFLCGGIGQSGGAGWSVIAIGYALTFTRIDKVKGIRILLGNIDAS
jgi:hypothetical protein